MSLWCESRAPTQTSMLGGGRLRLSDCVLTAERRDRKRAFDPRGWVLVVPTSRLEPSPPLLSGSLGSFVLVQATAASDSVVDRPPLLHRTRLATDLSRPAASNF